jgi:hypothetical protein
MIALPVGTRLEIIGLCDGCAAPVFEVRGEDRPWWTCDHARPDCPAVPVAGS